MENSKNIDYKNKPEFLLHGMWAKSSFVKCKGCSIGIDKILLEFVPKDEKTGAKNGPEIQIYLRFEHIIKLKSLLETKDLNKKRLASITAAEADKEKGGSGYAKDIYDAGPMGKKATGDKPAIARQFTIAPSTAKNKDGEYAYDYVLVARKGEGREIPQGNGKVLITFKDYKSAQVIRVPIKGVDLAVLIGHSYMLFQSRMNERYLAFTEEMKKWPIENGVYMQSQNAFDQEEGPIGEPYGDEY